MGSNVFKFPGNYSFSASGHDTGGIHAVTLIQSLSIPSVLSCKFVEEKNLPKSVSGKEQNAVIPSGIARLCDAAWRPLSVDLFDEFAIQGTSLRRRPKASQAQPGAARESWTATAQRRGALRLVQGADTLATTAETVASARIQPLRVLRLVEAGQAPGTAGRLRMSGRLADVCAELDRMASEDSSCSHALRA